MDLHRQMLDIDKRSAEWKMQEYRKLLEQVGASDGVGHAASISEQRLIGPAPPSRPALLPGPTHRQPEQPSPMAQEDGGGRDRRQRSVLEPY